MVRAVLADRGFLVVRPYGYGSSLRISTTPNARLRESSLAILRASYKSYTPVPPGVWRDMHQLYLHAEQEKIEPAMIPAASATAAARFGSVTLWIGTSGWQYRHWRGKLYARGLPTDRWFERYAEAFDTAVAAAGVKVESFNIGYDALWPPESYYLLRRLLLLIPLAIGVSIVVFLLASRWMLRTLEQDGRIFGLTLAYEPGRASHECGLSP